jgi:hypothetical protein
VSWRAPSQIASLDAGEQVTNKNKPPKSGSASTAQMAEPQLYGPFSRLRPPGMRPLWRVTRPKVRPMWAREAEGVDS